jgi:hypothetical protein
MNHPWANMTKNEPVGAMMNNNGVYAEQQGGTKNRARSVDTGPRNNLPMRLFNVPQQHVAAVEYHHRHRQYPTNHVDPSVENGKEQNVSSV